MRCFRQCRELHLRESRTGEAGPMFFRLSFPWLLRPRISGAECSRCKLLGAFLASLQPSQDSVGRLPALAATRTARRVPVATSASEWTVTPARWRSQPHPRPLPLAGARSHDVDQVPAVAEPDDLRAVHGRRMAAMAYSDAGWQTSRLTPTPCATAYVAQC